MLENGIDIPLLLYTSIVCVLLSIDTGFINRGKRAGKVSITYTQCVKDLNFR